MKHFKANFENANGHTTTIDLTAKTVLGAKREAYRIASGDTTEINILEDGSLVGTRIAKDPHKGFCSGANKWE